MSYIFTHVVTILVLCLSVCRSIRQMPLAALTPAVVRREGVSGIAWRHNTQEGALPAVTNASLWNESVVQFVPFPLRTQFLVQNR